MALVTKITGRVVKRTARPWEMDGRSGTTYRLHVLVGDELVFVEVGTERELMSFEVGKDYEFSGEIGKTANVRVSILDTRGQRYTV